MYEKCFVSCKNVCLPLIPFKNLKKQVSSANPSWWVLGKWWAEDGKAYATICRYSHWCLKKQAVGLHSYWEGYRNKLQGKKYCYDEKWLAIETGKYLALQYLESTSSYRFMKQCTVDLDQVEAVSLIWTHSWCDAFEIWGLVKWMEIDLRAM